MPRIFLPSDDLKERHIRIQKEQARYLTSVLRSKAGDTLVIFDGMGNCLKTTIIKTDKREVIAEVIETFPYNTESQLNITLMQGLMKGEKMDLVIQKATELGVKEIIPTITERSQIRETRKVERWRKIAEEASRQSGRTMIPKVHEPVEFCAMFGLGESGTRRNGEMRGFILWEEGGLPLKEAILKISSLLFHPFTASPIHILIGPEGGFTEEEVNLAKSKGLIVASLGRRILRAETAAISAVTLVQFLLGDLG